MVMASSPYFEVVEHDDAGNITSTYIESHAGPTNPEHGLALRRTRVEKIIPKEAKSYLQKILDVFLPAGYPHSVTEDYIQYQIYDSLQAFSSSIAGLLASRAVLEGVGVGDASASPTAALLLSILQESTGRLATILFAHKLGTSLEPECKMYRLLADILNDAAMVLDCLSPAFPKPGRVCILSFSSVLRSLCGVCAGSSKASLSAHFATKGNLGELNAYRFELGSIWMDPLFHFPLVYSHVRDIELHKHNADLSFPERFEPRDCHIAPRHVGTMQAGSVVVSRISTPFATWATLIALLSIHLATNYAAVTAVSMRSLNRRRANIVLSQILEDGSVLRPSEVSKRERVFERDGVLRWTDDCIIGHCSIGVPLERLLRGLSLSDGIERRQDKTGSRHLEAIGLSDLMRLYVDQGYILWCSHSETTIVLKEGCTPVDQLRAWGHALMLAQRLRTYSPQNDPKAKDDGSGLESLLAEVKSTMEKTRRLFDTYEEKLRQAGWDLNTAALETRASSRVSVLSSSPAGWK